MSKSEIILSASRALLFNILPSIRFIYVVIASETELHLHIYSEDTLSLDEKDLYNSVAGEMEGDFSRDTKVYTIFTVDKSPYSQKYQGILVYAKYEY